MSHVEPGQERAYCDITDIENDLKIRRDVHEALRAEVGSVFGGKAIFCTNIRRYVGNVCGRLLNSDRMMGQSDPLEFYQRLCGILDYYPIELDYQNYWASDEHGNNMVLSSEISTREAILPSVKILKSTRVDLTAASFLEMQFEEQDVGWEENPSLRFRASQLAINKADAIVIHINRRNFGLSQNVDETFVRVHDRITLPNHDTYILRSAVFSKSSHHYTSFIACGSTWYLYNDLEVNRNQTPLIETTKYETADVLETLSRKGSLLFYFKI